MRIDRLTIPARDPTALSEWYGALFGADSTTDSEPVERSNADRSTAESTATVQLGESILELTAAETPSPVHVAIRLYCEPAEACNWLAEQATILPIEGEQSRYFDFLDATAIYFEDPDGNVLEGLCYVGDPRPVAASRTDRVGGITEIGLPAPEPLGLVEWLEATVGLSAWGSPTETFAWVGHRDSRFVVVPAGRSWYPTDRSAEIVPISVRLSANSADPGRHSHPKLPYEIIVEQQ